MRQSPVNATARSRFETEFVAASAIGPAPECFGPLQRKTGAASSALVAAPVRGSDARRMIPFVRDIKFEYGRCDVVSPLIRRVIANNPGPFTFTGTGTYIIGHGEGVAVIDPGPDISEHLQAILDCTAHERISHIFITHHHLDHSPLARPLAAATGAV